MRNLCTWKMTAEEMRALKLHFQFIGTTWTEWEERQRGRNEPITDTYPKEAFDPISPTSSSPWPARPSQGSGSASRRFTPGGLASW